MATFEIDAARELVRSGAERDLPRAVGRLMAGKSAGEHGGCYLGFGRWFACVDVDEACALDRALTTSHAWLREREAAAACRQRSAQWWAERRKEAAG